jgi:hypothetical protein
VCSYPQRSDSPLRVFFLSIPPPMCHERLARHRLPCTTTHGRELNNRLHPLPLWRTFGSRYTPLCPVLSPRFAIPYIDNFPRCPELRSSFTISYSSLLTVSFCLGSFSQSPSLIPQRHDARFYFSQRPAPALGGPGEGRRVIVPRLSLGRPRFIHFHSATTDGSQYFPSIHVYYCRIGFHCLPHW